MPVAAYFIVHSVQVDQFGTPAAFAFNADRELERNRERYVFLKWGQKAFQNCRVVPPDVDGGGSLIAIVAVAVRVPGLETLTG